MTPSAIASDDTLDRLLAALLEAPRDADLIAVIADRLEGADGNPVHPAAAWWRKQEVRQLKQANDRRWWFQTRFDAIGFDDICEPWMPGIADLCRRLDCAGAEKVRRIV